MSGAHYCCHVVTDQQVFRESTKIRATVTTRAAATIQVAAIQVDRRSGMYIPTNQPTRRESRGVRQVKWVRDSHPLVMSIFISPYTAAQ